jgi:hypothetical protein
MNKKCNEYAGIDLTGLSAASREAIVTHVLEDMIPDSEMIAHLREVDAGKIDLDMFVKKELDRILGHHDGA